MKLKGTTAQLIYYPSQGDLWSAILRAWQGRVVSTGALAAVGP